MIGLRPVRGHVMTYASLAAVGDPAAPAVLLLHGSAGQVGWRKVIPPLAVRCRVRAPDPRGAGWTDAPADGYTAGQVLAQARAAA
jgi:pimeloyl-ACP methyl ester carboxylesterase